MLRQNPDKTVNITQIHDTWMSPASLSVARYAVGAVCEAVDYISTGRLQRAFCNVRPPGHHAGRSGKTEGAESQVENRLRLRGSVCLTTFVVQRSMLSPNGATSELG